MLNNIYKMLNPVAFTIGSLQIRWYGLAYLFAFLVGSVLLYFISKRWKLKITPDDISSYVIGIMFGVILGGRLGYVLFYGAGYYFQNPLEIFAIWDGGMSFHGGLVGALIGAAIACRMCKLQLMTMLDLTCIVAPIGLFFGRCANFINGELWGKPTNLPWGVVFESGGNVARHPSQLYEAVLEGLVIFCVLFVLSRKTPARRQGTFSSIFLILYGIFRIAVEFVRLPDVQLGYLFGPITMGQVLSLPLIIAGIGILVWAHKANKPQCGKVVLEANNIKTSNEKDEGDE